MPSWDQGLRPVLPEWPARRRGLRPVLLNSALGVAEDKMAAHFQLHRICMNLDSTQVERWILIWIEKYATGSELKSSGR